MKNQILVAGSINMDLVVEVEKLPDRGESVFGKTIRYILGGKGANQAIAAARLGSKVSLIGKVGEDHFGQQLMEFLKTEHLALGGVSKSPVPSGLAIVMVDKNANNAIVALEGANAEVSEDYIKEHTELIKSSNIVLSTNETPTASLEKLFSLAKSFNKTTMLNTAPALQFPKSMWRKIDFLILNETELAFYTGSKNTDKVDDIVKNARILQRKGPKTVVATIGERGVVTVTNDKIIRTEGIKVNAVDTTAAGDCFIGALAAQINNDVDLEEALDFANRTAAISVQRWGASSSLPHLSELDNSM